jgi:hypothetical protein
MTRLLGIFRVWCDGQAPVFLLRGFGFVRWLFLERAPASRAHIMIFIVSDSA